MESLLATPLLWSGGGVLLPLLLVASIVVRRRAMSSAMAVHARPADAATMQKLAQVRERFGAADRLTEQPLAMPNDNKAVGAALRMADAAHAARFARESAVHLAYSDLLSARRCIDKAIKLDPHRDEHKLVLVTVFESMGEHAQARQLVDAMLTRREQLSGELLAQVEQFGQRRSAG